MNNLLLATFSVVVYAFVQVLDAKIIQKEKPKPKSILRRCVLMFMSVVTGITLYEQFSPSISQISENINTSVGGKGTTKVFTDNPGF